jgi:hypothetical protein
LPGLKEKYFSSLIFGKASCESASCGAPPYDNDIIGNYHNILLAKALG